MKPDLKLVERSPQRLAFPLEPETINRLNRLANLQQRILSQRHRTETGDIRPKVDVMDFYYTDKGQELAQEMIQNRTFTAERLKQKMDEYFDELYAPGVVSVQLLRKYSLNKCRTEIIDRLINQYADSLGEILKSEYEAEVQKYKEARHTHKVVNGPMRGRPKTKWHNAGHGY
jgi:hypothetical protein